ncbi:tripeptidyl peptidase protein [Lasallia pustulata]|uniref:Tripeptidyl peptidase protein n=1 Tax=Lasallia pustulata TaxID=136370 RepID=A0A1W5D6R8_9LECA|nr:tripeptidyl peptidase protein [Lasallia pustulata]
MRSTLKPVNPIGTSYQSPKWHSFLNASNITVAQACNATAVTPLCLRTLYGTYDYTPKVPGINKVGLTDYLGESNNRSDIYLFLQMFRPEAASEAYTFTFDIIANGSAQQTPDNATQLGAPDLPQTISTSYGDDEQTVPYAYATLACQLFAQLGARGITLLFASGDSGLGPTGVCLSNDGKNTTMFLPSFHASCPYVTTVGATKNFAPEVAAFDPANNFASGGGFSNYFPRPAYQDPYVPDYIASLGSRFQGLYNASGRGYPDIAAQGFRFLTVWDGGVVVLDGTSGSTPTAAGVVSLVNDALLAAGRALLGWLNPWLYGMGKKGFTDVVEGSAIGCGGEGFPAEAGWDAVTGWGTPVS